ncbi:MAG TPA: choice-of-anchor tandem repeat GloVer-containing protein [Rhizomicrobium sp.]|nr:choice-of-anchor tandem repeat GloVer-containing protein [Rhizomicrobium sp.]
MKILPTLIYSASALAFCASGASPSTASTEKVLYNFPVDSYPAGRPDQDNKGALYGTADNLDGSGAIFRLKQKNGLWSNKTLFDFGGSRGAHPWSGPLIDRSSGILYGTTTYGGTGYGTVYDLAPAGRGWSEEVLHNFSGSDGSGPVGVLLKDKATGNLYGTTNYGATGNCGTAFQLVQVNGNWNFGTIYNFHGGSDACNPQTQLKPSAKAGTLIGATYGQVFQLKERQGAWSDSIIYTLTYGTDGGNVWDLDASSDGAIYGVTNFYGQYGYGTVFKLTPNLKNKYTFSVIYSFRGGNDGAYGTGINFDAASGNLYGATSGGGTGSQGTVFRLVPGGNGWTETVLHSFVSGSDGAYPYSRPIVDRTTGALYGTTTRGGTNDGGTVYMVQP